MTRTVLVTGSSRGLGAVIAKTLATQGFEVIINYNQSREAAEALQRSLVTKLSQFKQMSHNVMKLIV